VILKLPDFAVGFESIHQFQMSSRVSDFAESRDSRSLYGTGKHEFFVSTRTLFNRTPPFHLRRIPPVDLEVGAASEYFLCIAIFIIASFLGGH
jgi:hypothetical protein